MKSWLKWTISFLHAFLLIAFTAFWMSTDYTYGDERFLIKWSSILKRVVFHIDEDPPKKDFLFINLAYEKALIQRDDGPGTEVITDREKLTAFFNILKRHQNDVKFTVCDVLLKGASLHDSLLQSSVSGIQNVVFPTHLTDDGQPEKLTVNVPHAIADYQAVSGGFLKFNLFQNDTLPTLPVYLFEVINGRKLETRNGWYFEDGRPALSTLIIDYQIRSHELFEEAEYPVITLSELLMLPEEVIVNEFLKGRMIIMGDFNQDIHDTVFGSTPGPLILLNVFLTLNDGHHLISIWWLIFLLVSYTLFSRLMLFPNSGTKHKQTGWAAPLFGSAIYLSVLSFASYMVFNQHIQVLIITLYINLLRFFLQLNQPVWSKANTKKWLIDVSKTYFKFK